MLRYLTAMTLALMSARTWALVLLSALSAGGLIYFAGQTRSPISIAGGPST